MTHHLAASLPCHWLLPTERELVEGSQWPSTHIRRCRNVSKRSSG